MKTRAQSGLSITGARRISGALSRCLFRDTGSCTLKRVKGSDVRSVNMAKRINFFATKNDMVSILSKLEEQFSYGLKYVQCAKTERIMYETVKEIHGLGTLKEKHSETSFLIMRKDDEVTANQFGQVYQGDNSRSLEFDPSGISEDGTGLIHGMFAAMEDNEISDGLLKAVKKILNSECKKVRGWYIGKEAESLYGKLRFVCIGISEPEDYDFKIVESEKT